MVDVPKSGNPIEAYKSVLKWMQDAGAVCKEGVCMDKILVTIDAYESATGVSYSSSSNPQGPATWVTPYGARSYCKDLGKRLPTNAEWEKFADPKDPALHGRLVNSVGPRAVASSPANIHGVYDMTRNVWQWTDDGGSMGLRGGSYLHPDVDFLRAAFGYYGVFNFDSQSFYTIGFRCVRDEVSEK